MSTFVVNTNQLAIKIILLFRLLLIIEIQYTEQKSSNDEDIGKKSILHMTMKNVSQTIAGFSHVS